VLATGVRRRRERRDPPCGGVPCAAPLPPNAALASGGGGLSLERQEPRYAGGAVGQSPWTLFVPGQQRASSAGVLVQTKCVSMPRRRARHRAVNERFPRPPVAPWAHLVNEGYRPRSLQQVRACDEHILGLVRELESTDAYDPVREPPRPRTPGRCGFSSSWEEAQWRTTRLTSTSSPYCPSISSVPFVRTPSACSPLTTEVTASASTTSRTPGDPTPPLVDSPPLDRPVGRERASSELPLAHRFPVNAYSRPPASTTSWAM
jgi:hypothetical protein